MNNPTPHTPQIHNALAREVLEALRGKVEAGCIVIGGGVALHATLSSLSAWW